MPVDVSRKQPIGKCTCISSEIENTDGSAGLRSIVGNKGTQLQLAPTLNIAFDTVGLVHFVQPLMKNINLMVEIVTIDELYSDVQ